MSAVDSILGRARSITSRGRRRIRRELRDVPDRLRGAPDGWPIPPPRLQALVSGDARLGTAEYFEIGRHCTRLLERALSAAGTSLAAREAILDFGCGCGRVLRHVATRTEAALHGTDRNPELVAWCRAALPFAEFHENDLEPPLPNPEASFDLIYAFSVLTHLPPRLEMLWMRELVRVVRPGGWLFLTTQGEAYLDGLAATDRARAREGGRWVVDAEEAGSNRCLVYHEPDTVVAETGRGLALHHFEPGRVIDARRRLIGQDAFLFRKAEAAAP